MEGHGPEYRKEKGYCLSLDLFSAEFYDHRYANSKCGQQSRERFIGLKKCVTDHSALVQSMLREFKSSIISPLESLHAAIKQADDFTQSLQQSLKTLSEFVDSN